MLYAYNKALDYLRLVDDKPDEDGRFKGYILPKLNSRYLLHTSKGGIVSIICAYYKEVYDIVFVASCITITSQIYWSKPKNDWRRWLDIITVFICWNYQHYRAYQAELWMQYAIITLIATGFYPMSLVFHKKGYIWAGTVCHGFMHTLGYVAASYLTLGHIPKLH